MNPRLLQILIAILALGILGYGSYQTYKLLYKPTTTLKPKVVTLTDYLTTPNTYVKYTLIGPIRAPERHVEQTFTVSSSARNISITKGYSESSAYNESASFNQAAYEDFMRALQNAGYTSGAGTTSKSTEVGDCPTGTRAVYELYSNGASVFRTWSSICETGTFTGAPSQIRSLFTAQYPGLSKLPADLRL